MYWPSYGQSNAATVPNFYCCYGYPVFLEKWKERVFHSSFISAFIVTCIHAYFNTLFDCCRIYAPLHEDLHVSAFEIFCFGKFMRTTVHSSLLILLSKQPFALHYNAISSRIVYEYFLLFTNRVPSLTPNSEHCHKPNSSWQIFSFSSLFTSSKASCCLS